MNTKEHTYVLDKQTAKDIAAVRRAQNQIDKIELDDGYGFKPPDSPDIAYLKNGVMLPPFRCDIVAKWTQIADRQEFRTIIQPDLTIRASYSDKGEWTLRCGQSSVRLFAIDEGANPPIHPLPIVFDGDKIKLDFDPKEITARAKLLTSKAARLKAEAKQKAAEAKAAVALTEYERCKAILTPEAIRRCTKRVKRLRKLNHWLRKIDTIVLTDPPGAYPLSQDPLFNAFDRSQLEAYGNARSAWIEAKRKRDNFKPRSWRSKGLEKHNENVGQAWYNLRRAMADGLRPHVKACGFELYGLDGANDPRSYDTNDVRRCRKYVREYERGKTLLG